MRRVLLAALVVVGTTLGVFAADGRSVSEVAPGQLSMTPIKAVFLPAPDFATRYTFTYRERNPRAKMTISWHLYLKLIDTEGQPASDVPDSGAELDLLCSNAKFPGRTHAFSAPDYGSYGWDALNKPEFIWYHGDQGVYASPPGYGCDHKSMGPSGHQGIVSVEIYDKKGWVCHARYSGTNDGTGAKPRCERTGLPPNADLLTRVAISFEKRAIDELRKPAHDAGTWRRYVDISEGDLAGAIADVKADGFPTADDAVSQLQAAKAHDADALKPKSTARRISDLQDAIEQKQLALTLITRDS
jgi:hypothetical protein